MDFFEQYYEIKKQVTKEIIAEHVLNSLDFIGIDFNAVADTQAIRILDEIRNVIIENKPVTQTVTEIREIFTNHKISCDKPNRTKKED